MYGIQMRPSQVRKIVAQHSSPSSQNSSPRRFALLALLSGCVLSISLTGCGGVVALGGVKPAGSSLVATPSAIDFGSVSIGNSSSEKLAISNNGSDSVQIAQLSVSNTAFRVEGLPKLPITLEAGSTLAFKVHFSPSDSSDSADQLSVITSGSSDPAATIKLHGKGSSKNVQITGLTCDQNNMTGAGSAACTVSTSTSAPSGGVRVQLSSSVAAIKVPASVTVPPGAKSATFNAAVAAVSAIQTGVITATQGSIVKSFSISLSPSAPAVDTPDLRALSCANTSFPAAGKTTCTVSLTTKSPTALTISLASSSSAISIPAAVTVAASSSAASFTAKIAAVGAAQTATISAAANGSSKTLSIQLKGSKTSTPGLSLSASALDFGSVTVGTAVSKSVVVTSSGTASLILKSDSVSGSGFSVTGGSFPVTLKPGESLALTVRFKPSAAALVTGQLAVSSNAGVATVGLHGTGAATKSAPTIGAISCKSTSITGSLADPCSVSLSSTAPTGGVAVTLASSSTKVAVPAGITVPAGAAAASFTAEIAAVGTAQTATISAAANGSAKSIALQLRPSAAALALSASSLSFGDVAVGTSVAKSVTLTSTGTAPVTIKSDSITGTGFSVSGGSFPATLNPGQALVLTVQFNPTTAGSTTGQLVISSSTATSVVSLSGSGSKTVPGVSALSCDSTSITGSAADSCKVTLSGSAPKAGVTVALISSSTKLTVPASVTIPATATSATFTANAAAVSTAQSVKLTASSGNTSRSISLQLNPASAQLSINATTISFGAIVVNHQTTQIVTLTSTGKAAVTVKSASVTGAGFSLSPVTLPATLNPGQTLLLTLIYSPTTTGSQNGQLTIVSNSSTNPTVTLALSGTSNPHRVTLNWNSPSATVSNYKVYRANAGSGVFAKLATVSQTTYTDATVLSGKSYEYYVTSVGSTGIESKPSNITSVTIP